ncbi:MAG: ThuA domain-containing protein [Bacteroidales bacterium]|nr:ThuA domain-containing protein [Bacteroidales bacterium]
MKFKAFLAMMLVAVCAWAQAPDTYPANYAKGPRFHALLYYSTTEEPAHVEMAEDAIKYFKDLTVGDGWILTTDTSLRPYLDNMDQFDIIIAVNAQPHDPAEREAFQKYMENGGGWLGFHAAAYNDRNTHWPWFNEFLGCGAFYCNSWPPQPVLLTVDVTNHPVTKNLPVKFVAPENEWYMWNPSPAENPDVEVLLSLDQSNYPLGLKDVISFGDFPIAWTNHKYRMVYLNMGHGNREFTDATQNLLVVNAFRWVVSQNPKGNPFLK